MNLSELRNPYVLRPRFLAENYTAKPGDLCHVDSGTDPLTITLPASPNVDTYVGVWDANNNANANNITIARNGQTIQGLADDWVINVDSGRVDLVFDGTTWQVAFVTVGGLNQTQVDARVVEVATGAMSLSIPVDSGWFDGSGIATLGGQNYGSAILPHIAFGPTANYKLFRFIPMRKAWDAATSITIRHFWTPSTTNTGDVRFQSSAGGVNAGTDLSTGNYQGSSGPIVVAANGNVNIVQVTDVTDIIEPSVSKGDGLMVMIQRRGDDGTDTFTGDVRLVGLELLFNIDTPTDD